MATKFNGRLNTNEFYNSIYNAVRLYMIYADNLKGMDNKNLAEKYRTDGGMYHDQSVFTDMDVIYSRIWDRAFFGTPMTPTYSLRKQL